MNNIERTILGLILGMVIGMEFLSLPSLRIQIKDLTSHTNILAHKCVELQYQLDVMSDLQRAQK